MSQMRQINIDTIACFVLLSSIVVVLTAPFEQYVKTHNRMHTLKFVSLNRTGLSS
jgi:hypothetical protein